MNARRLQLGLHLLFFTIFLVYVALCVDMALLQQGSAAMLGTGSGNILLAPDDLVRYFANLLLPMFAHPLLGAGVLTLTAAAVCLAARWLFRRAAGRVVPSWMYLLPAAFIAWQLNGYDYVLAASLALAVGLAAGGAYLSTSSRGAGIRLAAFVTLAAGVSCIAGGGAAVFALICAADELARGRSRVLGTLYALSVVAAVAAIYFLAPPWIPLDSVAFLFGAGSSVHLHDVISLTLWAYFPLATAILGAWGRWAAARRSAKPAGKQARKEAAPARSDSALSLILGPAVLACVTAALILAGLDSPRQARPRTEPAARAEKPSQEAEQPESWFQALPESRGFDVRQMPPEQQLWFKIRYYAQCHRWADVLDAARKLPSSLYDAEVAFDVNRALYHLGRLPYDMFAYPQEKGTDSLILSSAMMIDGLWYIDDADIWFELGQINLTEQALHEGMAQTLDHPEMYKRLARVYILKGNIAGARLFLTAMQRWPAYAAWAKEYLRQVEAGTIFTADPELAQIREVMNTKLDKAYGATGALRPGDLFAQLLEGNGHNRMAFEYLMGMLLLNKSVDAVAGNIGHVNDFGYADFPTLYQEALLIYNSTHAANPVSVPGRPISEETQRRFERFSRLFAAASGVQGPQKMVAMEQLRLEFGNSYFYFYAMDKSGSGGLVSRNPQGGGAK